MNKQSSFLLKTVLCLSALAATQATAYTPQTMLSDAKDSRTDYILSASMNDGSRNCGSIQQITNGWKIDTEAYFNHNDLATNTMIASAGGYFSTATGTFTAPINGLYSVNFSMRISTGNGDITLRHNGTRIAATGTNLVDYTQTVSGWSTWSTHSVSKNLYMNAGDTLNLWYESGSTTDCSIETSFKYNHFNVNLIRAVGGAG
ncbi:hypothetical protein KIH87_14020 [Paraneptunicella aestuarii]|uniref:hypothetical protein n=1 Tax=Paraneptunicella aestuarii TaxID=2831148 RepID=UPI001E32CE4B|nr:hypothetical protein [Paraneptunicella aestuarii]UAA37809.1 hypothetical protein KIH87_14020 [Paraneptunicella aestuarii]